VDHREEEVVDLLYESLDRILSSSTSSISASDDNGADNHAATKAMRRRSQSQPPQHPSTCGPLSRRPP
jgi:hypothetical protein